MFDSVYRTTSGMLLEQQRQEIIARNLAGGNRPGFKREFIVSDTFSNTLNKAVLDGEKETNLPRVGKGSVMVDFSQGELMSTNRPLDFALEGENLFFEVKTPDGQLLYTRNGAFNVSNDNTLVSDEGYLVSGEGVERIQFADDDDVARLQVYDDGVLNLTGYDRKTIKNIAQLKIVKITDRNQLQRISSNYFTDPTGTLATTPDVGKFKVCNGYLESSNSTPIRDMVSMVESMREFEMGQKVLKMLNERFSKEMRELA